ncbi:MAG: LysR family transcriptional regulator [Paracoccaceae bacterium]
MAIDWTRLPPLSALRAFEAVASAGSFSAAGRSLNVTHAAVAQQVRALEAHLGVALVVRDGRAMTLTAEGVQLAGSLTEGFGLIATGVEALRSDGGERPVRLTLTAVFAAQWLMPRLRDFWQRYPQIGLSLHPDARVVDLLRERMDVGIRYGNGNWPGVEARFLASARLVVAGAPSLVGKGLTREAMAVADWIIAPNWPEQDNYLRSLGLDPATLSRIDFPGEELAIAAARQGLGLVVESVALMESSVADGSLVLVHDSRDHLPAYFIVTPAGPQRRAVRQFLAWLSDAA